LNKGWSCPFYELDDCYLASLNLLFETEVRINENIRLEDVNYVVVNPELPPEEKTEIEKILGKKGIQSRARVPKTQFCKNLLEINKISNQWWPRGKYPQLESEDFQKYLRFLFDYNRFVAELFGVDYKNAIKESRKLMGETLLFDRKHGFSLDPYEQGIIAYLDREKYSEQNLISSAKAL